jgi:hypothetical protein
VRDAARQTPDGIHLLRLAELLFGALQRVRRSALLRQVARRCRCADDFARRVANRRDRQ